MVAREVLLLEDLRGKRVGYAHGSNAHFALLNILAEAGVPLTSVTLAPMDVGQMPEALRRGNVTAFSAWEPFPAVTARNQPQSVVIRRMLSSGFMYFSPWFVKENPEAVRLILAAQIRAMRWMDQSAENLRQASRLTLNSAKGFGGQNIQLPAEMLAQLGVRDLLGLGAAPAIPQNLLKEGGRLHQEFIFLQKNRLINPANVWPETAKRFTSDLLLKVLAQAAKYRLAEFAYQLAVPER